MWKGTWTESPGDVSLTRNLVQGMRLICSLGCNRPAGVEQVQIMKTVFTFAKLEPDAIAPAEQNAPGHRGFTLIELLAGQTLAGSLNALPLGNPTQ
jgi:hypothetical protein